MNVMWYSAIMHCSLLCWPANSWHKMPYKKMFRIVKQCCQPCNFCWYVQYVSQAYNCVYTYVNLSSFFMMHPDLVLVTSPSCLVWMFISNLSVPSFLLVFVLLVECSVFSATCWLGLFTVCPMFRSFSVMLVTTCFLFYTPGLLSMLLSISANGSVAMLHCL